MIPNLLWRCPLCETNDSLRVKKRLFRPAFIRCSNCNTLWQAKRVIGDDFLLKVLESPAYPGENGSGLPLAQWYDRMKATVSLEPISDPEIALETGERLFLASRETTLLVNQKDPIAKDVKEDPPKVDRYSQAIVVGAGRVFLTDRRFIWQADANWGYEFPLIKINSAFIAGNHTLMILYELRILDFRFKKESLLKWLTYFWHVGNMIQDTQGHLITTSNF
jgi:hypothetical protein